MCVYIYNTVTHMYRHTWMYHTHTRYSSLNLSQLVYGMFSSIADSRSVTDKYWGGVAQKMIMMIANIYLVIPSTILNTVYVLNSLNLIRAPWGRCLSFPHFPCEAEVLAALLPWLRRHTCGMKSGAEPRCSRPRASTLTTLC